MNERLKSHVEINFQSLLLSNENCPLILQCLHGLHPHEMGIHSLHSNWLWAGWPGGSGFNSCYGQDLSLLDVVQTSFGAHPAPGSSFPVSKADYSTPTSVEVKNV
jgi:hypothetical protein